jgi:hypothetical protein
LQISHFGPIVGKGFGTPSSKYCSKVGHSFLWCPYVLHNIHQTTSLFSFPCSGSTKMLDSLDPLLDLLLLDLCVDTRSMLVVPLPEFETFVVSKDNSSEVIESSQITAYVACQ